ALVVEQLSEVEDGRLVALEPGGEPLGVSFVGKPLLRVARVRRVAAGFFEQRWKGLVGWLRPELLDVDTRRHLVHPLDMADDLLEHSADVRGADERRARLLERLPSPGRQLLAAAHRVLELGAVRLDRERSAGGGRDR